MRGRLDLLTALSDALPAHVVAPLEEAAASGVPVTATRPGTDAVARGILDYWLALPEHLRPEG
jgi:hypothetical protein